MGSHIHMAGCQNYGPFLGPYCNTAPNISGTEKRGPNFHNYPYFRTLGVPYLGVHILRILLSRVVC